MSESNGYDNSGSVPLRVPGIGLPLDEDGADNSLRFDKLKGKTWKDLDDSYFQHGIGGWNGKRLTVREMSMLALMESITDKPSWDTKVFDEAIVDKWRTEAMQMPIISESTWDWVLAEVRDKALAFKDSRKVLSLDTNARCAKSDVLVSEELREALRAGVAPLLSVPEEQKDWHPGSNNQVLNLVHPSLYPLVYGRTRVLAEGGHVGLDDMLASCGQGQVAEQVGEYLEDDREWSTRFQWLPCEVEFPDPTGTDTSVRIMSYINNLHPTQHQALYRTIEKIIGLSIPLWNDVLLFEKAMDTEVRIETNTAEWTPAFEEWSDWDSLKVVTKTSSPEFPEVMAKLRKLFAQPNRTDVDASQEDDDDSDMNVNFDLDDPDTHCEAVKARLEQIEQNPNNGGWEFEWALRSAVEGKWRRIRSVTHPEPGSYDNYWKEYARQSAAERISLESSDWFRAQGLQVIVKLASIELTPGNPRYAGGSWHLEGMRNEHIVSTAIYYYDVDNTTTAQLSFRQGAALDDMDLVYEQDDHEPLCQVFGTNSMREESAVQVVGRISTPQGRLLAFPNTFQHKVEPFELVDKTKPGHRRFLVLWLVDPHYRVCSTRNVPPQQSSWWAEEAMRAAELGKRLPQELVEMVEDGIVDWPMGMEEAKKLRLELMAERTALSDEVDNHWESYNLCEH